MAIWLTFDFKHSWDWYHRSNTVAIAIAEVVVVTDFLRKINLVLLQILLSCLSEAKQYLINCSMAFAQNVLGLHDIQTQKLFLTLEISRTNPKSAILYNPSRPINTLAGFMSMWIIWLSWRCFRPCRKKEHLASATIQFMMLITWLWQQVIWIQKSYSLIGS